MKNKKACTDCKLNNIESDRLIRERFKTVSKEEQILSQLLLKNAIDKKSSVNMESDILQELCKMDYVIEDNNKFYLTNDGMMIAKGAISLHPELK